MSTTDEAIFSMRYKAFLPLLLGVIITTNTATGLIFNQNENTEQIDYNEEATKRRIKNAIQELEYQIEIKDLKKELTDCETNR